MPTRGLRIGRTTTLAAESSQYMQRRGPAHIEPSVCLIMAELKSSTFDQRRIIQTSTSKSRPVNWRGFSCRGLMSTAKPLRGSTKSFPRRRTKSTYSGGSTKSRTSRRVLCVPANQLTESASWLTVLISHNMRSQGVPGRQNRRDLLDRCVGDVAVVHVLGSCRAGGESIGVGGNAGQGQSRCGVHPQRFPPGGNRVVWSRNGRNRSNLGRSPADG
jgi:hypothetical protein